MNEFLKSVPMDDGQHRYNGPIPDDIFHKITTISLKSQDGEEGHIKYLLNDLGIKKGWYCEFGASDGLFYSNTYFLIKYGFSGLVIEGDKHKYNNLVRNYSKFKRVKCVHAYIDIEGDNSLERHLDRAKAPIDFDLLSIDIDHMDYYVWSSLEKYRPKIVIIEYNSYRDPVCEQLPNDKSDKPSSDKDLLNYCFHDRKGNGTSFHSMIKLGLKKGYYPINTIGGNLLFVAKEYIHLVTLPKTVSDNSEEYLHLYRSYYYLTEKKSWITNNLLKYNCFVRDQYVKNGSYIDIDTVIEMFKH